MKILIYHNPRWGKSRNSVRILEEKNVDYKIIEYLNKLYGLKIDKDKIKKIIEITKFSNLQDLEKKFGFNEKISQKGLFFRKGKSGSWKSQLDKKITDKIENLFHNEMKELNYL